MVPGTDLEYVQAAPFRVLLRESGVPEGFRIDVETPDAFNLVVECDARRPEVEAAGFIMERSYDEHTGHDLFIYTQTVMKTDPRLTGFYDFVEYRGYKLRVIDRNGEGALAIAHGPLAPILGFATHELVAYGRIQDPD